MKQTVIVIGSADVIKLSLIRPIGELGCNVISIRLIKANKRAGKPLDKFSKYVKNYYECKIEDLIKFLLDNCTGFSPKAVLFPIDDNSVYKIDESYSLLKDFFYIANVKQQDNGIVQLMNKFKQKDLAQKAGLNVVKGWVIPFVNGQYEVPNDIVFPCFIKGLNSFISSKSVQQRCDNKENLLKFLDGLRSKYPYPLLAEQYIEIDRELGFMAFSDGEINLIPSKVELLKMGEGTTHGVSMLGYITPLSVIDQQYKAIETFLKQIDYVGICNFDFIESHGKLYFVELNFRYAAYGYGILKSGVNLPSIYINRMNGLPISDIETTMRKSIHYFNEKIGLLNVIERKITWKDYFSIKKKASCMMVASTKDPLPYFVFLIRFLYKYAKSRLKKIKRH